MYSLNGKVAVITGAGSGIGRSLAKAAAAEGARLALSDINPSGLAETMQMLPAGTEARAYTLDVSVRDAVVAHADEVVRDFGAAHYLFNNAGMTLVGTIENLTFDEIDWLLGINLWGVIYGTKAFLPVMRAQKDGCIVNLSSVFGMVGYPAQGAYNISKFGVRGLTECLWTELEGTGVRAVSVHPGGIATSIEKSGRRCRNGGELEAGFAAQAQKMLLTPPEQCAAEIIAGVKRGRRRIVTGHRAASIYWLTRLIPNGYPALLKALSG